jgi:phospholipid/cholesterol/gamma-HCH transport system substrate-binding protein
LEQARLLSSCFNNVVIPWSTTKVPNNDSDPPAGEVYKEFAYGLVGVAGESRSGDANGQEFRVLGGGGTNTIAPFSTPDLAAPLTGVTPFNFLGSEPAKQSSAKTPFRPDVPCETQDPPNLQSEIGPAPTTKSSGMSATTAPPQARPLISRYASILQTANESRSAKSAGNRAQAKQLLAQAQQQYTAWLKDWQAYQRASGLHVGPPPPGPKKGGGA